MVADLKRTERRVSGRHVRSLAAEQLLLSSTMLADLRCPDICQALMENLVQGASSSGREGPRSRCPPIEASAKAGDLAPSSEIMGVRPARRHRLAHDGHRSKLRIFPAQGKQRSSIRWRGGEIGGKRLLQSEEMGISVSPPARTEPELDAFHHGAAQAHEGGAAPTQQEAAAAQVVPRLSP